MIGKVKARVFNSSGELIQEDKGYNQITTDFLAKIPMMVKTPSDFDTATDSSNDDKQPLTHDTKMTDQYLCANLNGSADFSGLSPAIIVEGTGSSANYLGVCKAEIFCRNESYDSVNDTVSDNADFWHLRGYIRDAEVYWGSAKFTKLLTFTKTGNGSYTSVNDIDIASYTFGSTISCSVNDTLVIDWTIESTT